MKKTVLILLSFVILWIHPNLALSDCVDLGRMTSWYVQGAHTIIFYEGLRPLAYVDIWSCVADSSSTIHLIQNYVFDSDSIIVNGEPCTIMTISSSSAQSY